MLKKLLAVVLVLVMAFCFTACGEKYDQSDLPEYPADAFEIAGLWAPNEMTEEAFKQYKDAGFNVLSFTNHDAQPRSSENQYYIGSKRTMEALELCKKVGIDVYIAYGASWFNRANEGDEYFDVTPFSKHDYYGEYMDIIRGIHINDEPNKEEMEAVSAKELIDDFKKVYPDKKYIVNLIPITANASGWGYTTYQHLLDDYGERIMSQFENPYISLDLYPFHVKSPNTDLDLAQNYKMIAETAKKYNAEKTFILQSSTGAEFEETLSEADMRWQVYAAIAYGADNLQYYCYSVPKGIDYNYCMLERDDKTPTELYYYIKEINAEIQKFASVILAYDWQEVIGVWGETSDTYRLSAVAGWDEENPAKFENAKHYVDSKGTRDLLITRFEAEEYGEGYMFVNFADRENANTVDAIFKDCKAVAIYGGEGYDGTPEIVELDEEGKLPLELKYGEGVFITPIVK